jgi:hypothetical protein
MLGQWGRTRCDYSVADIFMNIYESSKKLQFGASSEQVFDSVASCQSAIVSYRSSEAKIMVAGYPM